MENKIQPVLCDYLSNVFISSCIFISQMKA